ncbi:glycosyltransferase [Arsenicicoccus dermatophilus]|uniref:glycosyltransferase n=1 Tax=Arsenicicoccus dermatophilus TaxID=1076331 RepID=UPI003916DB52
MSTSTVDVVIAVHRTDRPVGRAAASVLAGAGPGIRPLVVGHGLDVDAVRDLLPEHVRDRTRVISHVDGIPAPGGPFNAGLDASEATYVAVMGSDDTVEPGAVEAWRAIADEHRSDAVVARVVHSTGGVLRTPPVRTLPLRGRDLDLARDRLAYRTAPLGLMRTVTLREHEIRLTEGFATGEDLAFSTRLWSLGRRLRYAADAPAYVIGHDAQERITTSVRPVADDLAAVMDLVRRPWFAGLPVAHRTAVGVKLLRIHLFGIAAYRERVTAWTPEDRVAARDGARAVLVAAPHALQALSVAERRLLDALLDPSIPAARLVVASQARRRHGLPATLVTPQPEHLLGAQAPLRLMVASLLMR